MTEAVVDTTPKAVAIKPMSGFATRSALEERIAKEEAELKTMMDNNKGNAEQDEDNDPTLHSALTDWFNDSLKETA